MTSKRIMWPMHMGDLEDLRGLVFAISLLAEAYVKETEVYGPITGITSVIGDKLDAAIKAVMESTE